MFGGPGDDAMVTAAGGTFFGNQGDDDMRAGDGGSGFRGGSGADTMIGGDGDSWVRDHEGVSVVRLGNGHGADQRFDNAIGVWGDGSDIRSGAGDDLIFTVGADITVHGGAGDDVLPMRAGLSFGGPGHDILSAYPCDPCDPAATLDLRSGDGDDDIRLAAVHLARVVNLEGGNGSDDVLELDLSGRDTDDQAVLTLDDGMSLPWVATVGGFEDYLGRGGHHVVTGTDQANRIDLFDVADGDIRGLDGDDYLTGADTIDGGDGTDHCEGGIVINCES